MRIIIFISLLFVLISCSSEIDEQSQNIITKNEKSISLDTSTVQLNVEQENPVFSEPIIRERIDGPANIRDSINGKILFELYDNALVETSLITNNWHTIGLYVKVDSFQVKKGYIEPNKNLIDENGNVIGRTKDTVNLIMDGKDYWLIWGETFKENIKPESIPELELKKLIEAEKIDSNKINHFVRNFNFIHSNHLDLEGIKLLFIYQSIIIDPSPRDRISLLFENNILIGFVHSRNMDTPQFKTYELIRGHKLTIIKDIKKTKVEKIIKNRKLFYNSID
jgi:uncharacterized protein YcfL